MENESAMALILNQDLDHLDSFDGTNSQDDKTN